MRTEQLLQQVEAISKLMAPPIKSTRTAPIKDALIFDKWPVYTAALTIYLSGSSFLDNECSLHY